MKQKREKIFIHDFSLTISDSKLRKYIKNNPELDPSYILASCARNRVKTKKWLEFLWKKYEPYAEPNFLKNLRSKKNNGFHTFSWQMYLATVLLDNGYELVPNNGIGPDLQIRKNGKNIWIEAVITTPGKDKNIDDSPRGGSIYKALDPRVARISNALTKKYKKYKEKYLGKMCKKDEPFLIAINGNSTETLFRGRAIEATVYGRGNDAFPMKRGSLVGGFYELRENIEIEKEGRKVQIPTNYFCTNQYNEISAIIYCERHIINANNFGRSPEAELYFAKNFYAKNKLGKFSAGNIIERANDGAITRKANLREDIKSFEGFSG